MKMNLMALTLIRQKAMILGSMFMCSLLWLILLWQTDAAFAHGYLESPPSRALQCKQGTNQECGAIKYEPQSLEALKGYPNSGPADGQIAGAGTFPELNQQSATRWNRVAMKTGTTLFQWKLTAAHATGSWRYYITKINWDVNSALGREDFESDPFCAINANGTIPSTTPSQTCYIPTDRKGYHVILAIWDIADTGNAFYNVVDVELQTEQLPKPTVQPTILPTVQPTIAPTVRPTIAPTVRPTIAPTGSPIRVDGEWSAMKVYVAGDRVFYQAIEYFAQWWTQGEQPDQSVVWKALTNSTSEWQSHKIYVAKDRAIYNLNVYEAQWWTQGEKPGSSSVWKSILANATPMPTIVPTKAPTPTPSIAPTPSSMITPTKAPTPTPTIVPTKSPAPTPTIAPTKAPTSTPVVGSNYKIVAYYPGWATYGRNYQVSQIDPTKITHINYAFANIANGEMVLGDAYADTDKFFPGDCWDLGCERGNFHQLKKLKAKHPALKTIISVGGWTWSKPFSEVAMTEASRSKFADSAVTFLRKWGFDGVDLDWEYPVSGGLADGRAEDRTNYSLLLQSMRTKLDAASKADGKMYLLTIASGAGPSFVQNTELDQIAKFVDWINIMTYDFHGGWDRISGNNAPLYFDPNDRSSNANTFYVQAGVDGHLTAGVPSSKLVLGLPFYGRGWQGCAAENHGLYQICSGASSEGTWEAGVFDYTDLEKNYINKNGYIRYWNDIAKVPYLYNESKKVMISYDDAKSIDEKLAFLKTKQLAGAMFWELSGDRDGILLERVHLGLK